MTFVRATAVLLKAANTSSRGATRVVQQSQTASTAAASTSKAASAAATGSATTAKATTHASSQETVPLFQTFGAVAAGVLTVAGGAAAVEQYTSSHVPPFDPEGHRFDQSTFGGRFCRMMLQCDPKLLLYSTEECQRAKAMVEDYNNLVKNPPEQVEDIHRTLWEAQRIYSAALHPDTGETIPAPFRMSGYVPFNGPIAVAMVASGSTSALLFWNWVNQSQNALVNYFNRNAASGQLSNETLAKSYAAAVGSALTVAFGLATFIQRRYDPVRAKKLLKFVAFPSSVVASSLNCYIVRSPEIDTGIPVVDENGQPVLPEGETSKIAAQRGVLSTTASRALLQAPVYFVPPLLLCNVPLFKTMTARNPATTVPLTTFLLLVSFGLGLPATVAIFPQMSEIEGKELEEKYWHLKDGEGRVRTRFYYNKGL